MFQAIMMRFGIEKHDEYMELLKKYPLYFLYKSYFKPDETPDFS